MTPELLQEALAIGKALGRNEALSSAVVAIAERHRREAEGKRDAALAAGDTQAGLIQAGKVAIAETIAREIEEANDLLINRLHQGGDDGTKAKA